MIRKRRVRERIAPDPPEPEPTIDGFMADAGGAALGPTPAQACWLRRQREGVRERTC
jgi:hypothetical protein